MRLLLYLLKGESNMSFFKKLFAREDLPPEEKEKLEREKEEKKRLREAEYQAKQEEKRKQEEAEQLLMEKYFGTKTGFLNKLNFSTYKKTILYFEQNIKLDEEEILAAILAEYDKTKKREIKGMLIATSERLVFVTNGIGHGQLVEIFEYHKMNGISYARDGLASKELLIDYGRSRKIFDDIIDDDQFKKFLNIITNKMNETKKNQSRKTSKSSTNKEINKYDLLSKVAKLHEQGILSDEEFQKEKEKILNS